MRRKLLRALPIVAVILIVNVLVIMWMNRVTKVHPDYPVQSFNGNMISNHMTDLIHSHTVTKHGLKTKWISMRMKRLASSWESARDKVVKQYPELFMHPKRILLFPGLLSEYSAYDFARNAFRGGYVGELIQWSDLLSALHLLGHKITIAVSKKQLMALISPNDLDQPFDLLFTDYLGMYGVHQADLVAAYKCKIRLLDSFGTEPKYSFRTKDFQVDPKNDGFSSWGFEDLRQLWTLYPHTPDNSFLGFTMPPPPPSLEIPVKKNQAVIYGKEGYYIQGREHFVDVIAEQLEVHATFKNPLKSMPAGVINHGVLPAARLIKLLQESKLFIGLGFPYEGPGPMEALIYGCVFIQPKFDPPHNRKNNNFFQGKPTERKYTSQNPYLETVVGEPKVYTVDARDDDAVRRAVRKVLSNENFTSFIPHEFTQEGMLERVGSYILNENFCNGYNLARDGTVGGDIESPLILFEHSYESGYNFVTSKVHETLASASSLLHSHSTNEAIDGKLGKETCYWSNYGHSHWWQVDLHTAYAIGMIRIIVMTDWFITKEWDVTINPFQVSLLDTEGNVVNKRLFKDSRVLYLWEDVGTKAQIVRIDTLGNKDSYLVLCGVEVFGIWAKPALWPHPSLLNVVMSDVGQTCNEACNNNKMRCEPAFFRMLNKASVLKNYMKCQHIVTMETQYLDFLPAYTEQPVPSLNLSKDSCAINGNLELLSCPGSHNQFKRLCPCREINKQQTALPPYHNHSISYKMNRF